MYQVHSDPQRRRHAFALGFGKTLMGLAVGVGILFLAAVLLLGMGWAFTKALPWLSWVPRIVFDICVFVLLPLCIFRKTRSWAGSGFYVASIAFGLLLFAFSCIVALEIWGYTGLIIGLFFGGVGVVPVAFLAALLHGEWLLLLNLVLGVVFTYGTRLLGIYLASGKQPPESSVNDDTRQSIRTMIDDDYSLDRLIQRAKVASPTGKVSPATRKRLETLSLELEDVNKKLEEHQEKQAWKEEVATWYRKAAEQGDADAQYSLGILYYSGQGVPQDYAQAAAWYRKAAEQGNVTAQDNLGRLYYNGRGVAQDYTQASLWFRKAAEQGNADAQYSLGTLYDLGDGVPQDYAQAAAWFRKAAEQGDADAQYALGALYDSGDGVPQDYAQAATWYRKGAEQGNARAQGLLGGMYALGQGVPQDYAEAYFWYALAATAKDASLAKIAAGGRDKAASYLTPADLSREQERARKWFEVHQAKPQ